MSERGEQAIAIPAAELRKLCRLPDEVDIVEVLPEPRMTSYYLPQWQVPDGGALIYLKIRSKYAFRAPPRSILSIETLDDFLARYRKQREAQRHAGGLLNALLDAHKLTSNPSQSDKLDEVVSAKHQSDPITTSHSDNGDGS